jgi:predicted signal transduction protein with EAL and GGDEF domain
MATGIADRGRILLTGLCGELRRAFQSHYSERNKSKPHYRAPKLRRVSKAQSPLLRVQAIDGNEIHISASIGIFPYVLGVMQPEAMMVQADLALYRAKEDGRNCFRYHSGDLDREVEERVTITEDLRGALDRGELELPLPTSGGACLRQITGMEALMRWHHPTRGLVPASVFIPIAERS